VYVCVCVCVCLCHCRATSWRAEKKAGLLCGTTGRLVVLVELAVLSELAADTVEL